MRGPEVLTEEQLFARFFDTEATDHSILTPPMEPVAELAGEALTAEVALVPPPEPAAESPTVSLFARVRQGLSRTRAGLSDGLAGLLLGKKTIDDDLLEEIETQLLVADVGMHATSAILTAITERMQRKELKDSDALYAALQEEMASILQRSDDGGGLHVDSSKAPTAARHPM